MTHQQFISVVAPLKGVLKDKKVTTFRRKFPRAEDGVFCPFNRDARAIVGSKAFRNMACKTQVTSYNHNGNIRNRMTHVLEVKACSLTIAEILGLNMSLVGSISLVHDIGHVALGHQGESFLAKRMGRKFTHEVMGSVVAQHIERKGEGLNLTFETLDGGWRHSGKNASPDMSQEAWVVRYADKFAYIFSDYNDLIRIGAHLPDELIELVESFGANQRQRVARVMAELCKESAEKGRVSFEDSDFAKCFGQLYVLMNKMYPAVTEQDVSSILDPIAKRLDMMDVGDVNLILALMNDNEVRFLSDQKMLNTRHFAQTGIWEGVPYLRSKQIDMCNVDLGWVKDVQLHNIP